MNIEELTKRICGLLDDKKAEDITILQVSHLTIVADYFVVATARSTAQAKAIADYVDEKLSKVDGIEPLRVDGTKEGRWVVMDYGGVIIHIFNDETRVMYCLDKLWNDGNNVTKYESK